LIEDNLVAGDPFMNMRRRSAGSSSTRWTMLLPGLIFAVVGCGGGGKSTAPPSQNGTQSGIIRGIVTAPSSIAFKPGSSINVTSSPASTLGVSEAPGGSVGVAGAVCTLAGTDKSATTDPAGVFTLTDVPPGSYLIICKKTAEDGTVYAFLKAADVQNGETVDLGMVEISQTGSIQGNATLVDQLDHTGITVFIPGTSMQARTDALGNYRLNDVPEGTYEFRFEKNGYGTAKLVGIVVTRGQVTPVSDVVLNLSTGAMGSLVLESGHVYSSSRTVSVAITASADATLMMISEDVNFVGSVWNPIRSTTTWSFASDGEHRLYAKFAAATGPESAPVSDSIIIDTTPPIDAGVLVNRGAVATNSPNVTLSLSATDTTTSVAQMKLGNDPALTDAAWESFTATHSWSFPAGDGVKTVYVTFKDLVGNETVQAASASIVLDTVLPTGPSVVIQEGTYTNTHLIHLLLSASGATAAKIGEDPNFVGVSPISFVSTAPWALSAGDGTKAVYVQYLDEAGNETDAVSASIVVDTTPPTVPVIFNQNQMTNQTIFSMTLSTPSSDTNFRTYQLRGGHYSDWADTAETSTFGFTLTQQGPNALSIRGKDQAGNVGSGASVTITLDTVNPVLSNINALTTSTTAAISWRTSEPASGQVDFGLNQDYGSAQAFTSLTTSHTALLNGLSSRTLYHYRITSTDTVGNTTASTDLTFLTQPAPMPTARWGLAVGVVNGVLYAVGGATPSHLRLTTVEAYDPGTNSWTTKAPMPTARHMLAAGVANGIIYAVGGSDNNGSPLSTVEAYNPGTNTWTTKASMSTPRSGLSIGVVNGIIYAVGGCSTSGCEPPLPTVEAYDPATNTWTPKASMPTERWGLAVEVVDGVLYALGGYNFLTGTLATVEAYDPVMNTWTTKASMPTARRYLAAGVVNRILYAVAGDGSSTVEAYDPVTNTWTTNVPMPTARELLAVGVVNNILYAVGGTPSCCSPALATVEAFIP
jgi:hypothetical protein